MDARSLAKDGSVQDAIDLIATYPSGAMQLVLREPSIRVSLTSILVPPPVKLFLTRDLEDFTYPPRWDPSKVLLIHGMSGLGKTSLACSLIPTALICKNLESLSLFDPKRNGGIIFDDCPIPFKDREMQLAILDNTLDRQIAGQGKWKMRYRNPSIPALTPMIMCTNLYPTQYFLNVFEVTRRLEVWKAVEHGQFVEDTCAFKVVLGERLKY